VAVPLEQASKLQPAITAREPTSTLETFISITPGSKARSAKTRHKTPH
jgi:hypothetical protein